VTTDIRPARVLQANEEPETAIGQTQQEVGQTAEAVAKGRELATPIELKPNPERLRQLSDKARREAQLYRIMSRTGQAGFKGFCPVALRNQRELLDGREEYQFRFGLKTYYFSSPEARDTFEANPARYAPAGGGSDVVLLVNTNEKVDGILDYSLWDRDRLYMFRSRETQAIFSQDPQKYASQY
jgi:YHS domain-containing protein